MLQSAPIQLETLPIDPSLGDTDPEPSKLDPATFAVDNVLSMFPAIPQRAEIPTTSLPASNDHIESSMMFEDAVDVLDAHVQRSRDAFGRQVQSRLAASLALVRSPELRQQLVQGSGHPPK